MVLDENLTASLIRQRSPQSVALRAILACDRAGLDLDEALGRMGGQSRLSPRDHAYAVELAKGTIRHQLTLDWRLQPILERPLHRYPHLIQTLLRIGAYQVLHMDRVNRAAAVNETVEASKKFSGTLSRDWSGFVNGVLRNLLRQPEPSWPDPARDPVEALAIRHSCPNWIASRWLARYGYDRADELCRRSAEIPGVTIRVNRLKIDREDLRQLLQAAGVQIEPTSVSPVGLKLGRCGPLTSLPGFKEGYFYIEDEAAQLIPPLLAPEPGERILDLCAAPGGKCTHLAELMHDHGEVVAVDRQQARLAKLKENVARLGLSSIHPLCADARGDLVTRLKRKGTTLFDRILVDAPCSGLGVLRRHPEGKWRKQASDLARHQRLQIELLSASRELLRPGGWLVYSTCSTEPEENEEVVERFCRAHPEFQRETVAPCLPPKGLSFLTSRGEFSTVGNHEGMDVFFAARLKKVAS
jgi:16S rRNA (cytosine967-C5)-methyltransferase